MIRRVSIEIASHLIETIVFDLENTLLLPIYKRNQVAEYDASAYIKLFGHSAFKVKTFHLNSYYSFT